MLNYGQLSLAELADDTGEGCGHLLTDTRVEDVTSGQNSLLKAIPEGLDMTVWFGPNSSQLSRDAWIST